jgi:hypothetical protein
LADPKFAPILEAGWLPDLLVLVVVVVGIWNFHKVCQIVCLHVHSFFFVFFLSLVFSLRTCQYCKQCARWKDTLFPHHWGGGKQTSLSLSLTSVIILDNEVVMAGLILIDIMVLNFAPDSIKFLHLGLLWSD